MKRRSRTTSTLSTSMQKRLNTYAVAAGAAGVSMIALAQPSAAEIVYTPANQTVGRHGSYTLDLNNDGTPDYIIAEVPTADPPFGSSQVLYVLAAAGNLVNRPSKFCSANAYAAALTPGIQIGYTGRRGWMGREVPMAFESLNSFGGAFYTESWANKGDGYLGLRFQVNGETHFGWARLSVSFSGGPPPQRTWEAHLTGYAYETVPVQALIRAGQLKGSQDDEAEASPKGISRQLGAIALGSSGMALWRRED